jgi:(p)ppGpp synthase/HD superfamily hydrolase
MRSSPAERLSFTRDLPLTRAAVDFASERHGGQRRQGDKAAFVIHPLEAASILERSRYPDEIVAAAVLHDVLEHTDTAPPELEDRFGPQVTRLVEVLSDDPAIEDEEARRDELRDRVREAGGYATAIYGATRFPRSESCAA